MAKMGRPTIDIDWEEFEKLCKMQCTKNEIASWFSCSPDTMENKIKAKYGTTFSAIYDQKREGGKCSLRRMQWKAAEKGQAAVLIFLGKQYLGQKDKQEIEQTVHNGDNQKLEELKQMLKDSVKRE